MNENQKIAPYILFIAFFLFNKAQLKMPSPMNDESWVSGPVSIILNMQQWESVFMLIDENWLDCMSVGVCE